MDKVVKTYLVILIAKPAVSLTPGMVLHLSLPLEGGETEYVTLQELKESIDDSSFPVGLKFKAEVTAKSIDEAIGKAQKLSDGIASFVTLVTGIGTPIVKPILCYEITDNKSEREFLQFFDDPPVNALSRKKIPEEKMTYLIKKYYEITNLSLAQRVARAIRWYRFGVGSFDLFDRFSSFWIGLEALNEPLQTRLNVDKDQIKCPKCGFEWTPFPTISGVRKFIDCYVQNGSEVYKRMHSLRISIMHSTEPLTNLQANIKVACEEAGNALLSAVQFLLNIPPPWISHKELLSNAIPFRLALKGMLVSDSLEDLMPENGEDAHFKVTYKVDTVQEINGKTEVPFKAECKLIAGSRVSAKIFSARIYGEGSVTFSISPQK